MSISESELPAVIESPRLRLRPARETDVEALVETQTDAAVRKYLGGPRPEAAVRRNLAAQAWPAGHYVVAGKDDDVLVGLVSLMRRRPDAPGHVTEDRNELELSYVFRRSGWGYGYATEAVRALLARAAGLLTDQPILIITQSANTASLRLAGRLGFRECAKFEEFGAQQTLAVAQLGRYASAG